MSIPLSTIRHSAAHVLAQAVLTKYPDAKLGIGPAIENGFYYDFDLPVSLTDADLSAIEKIMKDIIKQKQPFSQYSLKREKAIEELSKSNQTYKLELIESLGLAEYSFFTNGPFVDLCRGPHVEHTGQIKAIKLLKVSGAYWKGSEDNKMLQRIYGTAFESRDDLKSYLTQLEEAKKRDHRVLGTQLNLFSLDADEVGGGLVLWHPKGARIRHIIEDHWKRRHFESGYELLYSPHVGKSTLWKTSGHLDHYQENMYAPMEVENQEYYIRPMNCPFHIKVFQSTHHSYRDLPVRYCELGTVYRFERSGVLHGLMRVRGFTQDDAHIICTPNQVHEEIKKVLKFCIDILKTYDFKAFKLYVSTRPEGKSVGEPEMWEKAQSALENAVNDLQIPYELDEGGGAFYGPKIDVKIEDAIGREWQCSTIQFDFNLPERFDMFFINDKGEKERPYMIHRALLGSIERFFGILIEHYAGKFPLWLAPTQIKLLSITEGVLDYCKEVKKQLEAKGCRVALDSSSEKIGYKIRASIKEKVPYMLVVGEKEMASKSVAVRSRDEGDLGVMDLDAFNKKCLHEKV